MASAIEASGLTKVFPSGTTAVEALDLRIGQGSVFGLIGPNGAGKTTLLRLLMGLLRPEEGSARILQHDLWRAPRKVRSRIAYVAQAHQLHSWMTLEELSRYASHFYERWDAPYARTLASRWQLDWKRRVGQLSLGGQRKAALLLALACRPEVLLLDEPAAGLDPVMRRGLVDEILATVSSEAGCTVLFSTHLLEDLERIVDHIGSMDRGKLMISARLDDLQNTVRRVQVVFQGNAVPPGFAIPGALRMDVTGPVATALTRLANEAQLDSIRHLPGARLQVFPLNLEEIFLACFGKGQSGGLLCPLEPDTAFDS
jgi:ABC-2 type transport system ATP-binding protein